MYILKNCVYIYIYVGVLIYMYIYIYIRIYIYIYTIDILNIAFPLIKPPYLLIVFRPAFTAPAPSSRAVRCPVPVPRRSAEP